MNVDQLHGILLHTFSTDQAHRKAAEEALNQIPMNGDAITLLIQFTCQESLQREIRQAAAISVKNIIHEHWMKDETVIQNSNLAFTEMHKQQYRALILEVHLYYY